MARRVEQMVNERVLRWETARRAATPPPPSQVRRVATPQKPTITISRQCGSLGGSLGRLVAARMGLSFYSQELVHRIATAARVQDDTVGSMDEQARGVLEVMVREVLEGKAFAHSDYLYHLRRVVHQIGRDGRGLIVGRGGHLLLDPAQTLRIRTYAPIERRVENLVFQERMSREMAMEVIRRVDRERAQFYRSSFGVVWDDGANFDLSLNTAALPLGTCADIVVAAFAARFGDAFGPSS